MPTQPRLLYLPVASWKTQNDFPSSRLLSQAGDSHLLFLRTPRPFLTLLRADPSSEILSFDVSTAKRSARLLGWIWPHRGTHSNPHSLRWAASHFSAIAWLALNSPNWPYSLAQSKPSVTTWRVNE